MAKILQNCCNLRNYYHQNHQFRSLSSLIRNPDAAKAKKGNGIGQQLLPNRTSIITPTRLKSEALVLRMQTSPYMIMRASPDDFDEMIDLMWTCYYPDEPCTKALGLGAQRNDVFDERAMAYLQQGLSVVAKCRYNGNTVGGAVNAATSPWDPDLTERFACSLGDPDLRELYLFFAYLQRAPNLWKRYCTNKIFEISELFVAKEERGRGLAALIAEYSLELGADSDFRLLRVDATSIYSQKLCEKLKMKLEYDIPYCSYVGPTNEPVITPAPPHDISVKTYILTPHMPPK